MIRIAWIQCRRGVIIFIADLRNILRCYLVVIISNIVEILGIVERNQCSVFYSAEAGKGLYLPAVEGIAFRNIHSNSRIVVYRRTIITFILNCTRIQIPAVIIHIYLYFCNFNGSRLVTVQIIFNCSGCCFNILGCIGI